MKFINGKIAVLINWPRELDMYKNFLSGISKKKIQLIVNDIKSSEIGRGHLNKQIIYFLRKEKLNFKLFSEVFNKEYYSVIVSTGEASSTKITYISIMKFIYSNLIGRLIEITNISKIFSYFFGRPFSASFHRKSLGTVWYPEKKLAKLTIKFSDGMDLKVKNYPYPDLLKNFDVFLTISNYEKKLIKKKQRDKTCKVMGYTRFNNLDNKKKYLKKSKKNLIYLKKKGQSYGCPPI